MTTLFEILAFPTLIFLPNLTTLPPQSVGFILYEPPRVVENKTIKSRISANTEDFNPCSCVSGAKYILKIPQDIPWGNANEIISNSSKPINGGLILLNEGPIGHVGVVLNYSNEHITFEEYNGAVSCGKSVRSIPRTYPLIHGFRDV